MLAQSLANFRERVLKTFPERQFFHRTGGEVNFFVLGTKTQLTLVGIAGLLGLWCLFTLFNVLWGHNPLRSASQELRVKEAQYERYLVDARAQEQDARDLLVQQQQQFELAAKDFQDKHNTIATMITQGNIITPADDLETTTYAQTEILMSPTVLDIVERQSRTGFEPAPTLQTGTVLDASLVNLDIDQNRILASGELTIQDRIEFNRSIIRETGLSVDTILKNGADGMGGPLVALDGVGISIKPGEFLPRLDSIKARSAEVEALDKVMAAVPLAYPIDAENYVTSRYGSRKDPFTKRPTMHTGMDIASYKLAPIVATADGKISFSGRRPGYGRVVEIDHGYGFKTRYAHLEKTYVKRGQKIEKGEKIAGMGSTGRSTSTHLHYEVMFDKRTLNPEKFLKAGQYVQ
ncbi:MAG: M23 family metallopeptidase [Hyphomonadaceae bacterium]|nr:M23 family metallopeptidase [Hyphomonadaceae bacterium]